MTAAATELLIPSALGTPAASEFSLNPAAEKRREPRYATCDAAQVSLLDTPGMQAPGIVRDVSKHGLRVELALAVTAGSRLKISMRKRAIVFAVARYCRRTENTYQVGAEIESAYYPSRATTSLLQLSSMEPEPAPKELARSIVRYHMSVLTTGPDGFPCRMPPAGVDEPSCEPVSEKKF